MRYLVTGAEGFIGSRFLEAVDIFLEGLEHITAKPLHYLDIDAIRHDDVIVHLGALAGIKECLDDPDSAFTLNTASVVRLLSAARERGARMVFASSSAAANPVNPYAASKASAEAWCKAHRESYGVQVQTLRFGNVFGPRSQNKGSCVAQMCKGALATGEIVVQGGGYQERDFVYVDDVVEAVGMAPFAWDDWEYGVPGEFSVRTGAYTKVYQVARILAELSGAKIVQGERPKGDADRPRDAWAQFPMEYTPLEEGLEATWKWFYRQSSSS